MTNNNLSEIALIERILQLGKVKEAKWWDFARKRFVDAGWIIQSRRKGEWNLIENAKSQIEIRLNNLWPTRDSDTLLLYKNSLDPLNPKHLQYLPALRKQTSSKHKIINRRSLYSASGIGPKQKSLLINAADNVVITHDAISRFRPNSGLVLKIGSYSLNFDDVIETLHEFSLSERALMKEVEFKGKLPKTIITVENLGSYIDIVLPDNVLVIFSPGSDLRSATQLMKYFPEVNWIHFGDIDPEGMQIAHNLAKVLSREVNIYIPSFTREYISRAQKKNVTWDKTYGIEVLESLKEKDIGIYQEIFMLDERLTKDIESYML